MLTIDNDADNRYIYRRLFVRKLVKRTFNLGFCLWRSRSTVPLACRVAMWRASPSARKDAPRLGRQQQPATFSSRKILRETADVWGGY